MRARNPSSVSRAHGRHGEQGDAPQSFHALDGIGFTGSFEENHACQQQFRGFADGLYSLLRPER